MRSWASTFLFVAALFSLTCGAHAEKRVALVIGNSAYQNTAQLKNPRSDAEDMSAALKRLGFEVISGVDLDDRGMSQKVRDFARSLEGTETALFFYAGHGLQAKGQNYLLPVNAALKTESDLDFETVSLDLVMKQMQRSARVSLVFLDACRDNPLSRSLSASSRSGAVGSGLARVEEAAGMMISFSTQPGNVALDGTGRNSPFTAALAKHVREPDHNLTSVMIQVRKDVLAATGGKQVPWDHSALTGEFYFQQTAVPGQRSVTGGGADSDVQQRMRSLEDEVKKKSDAEQTTNIVALAQARERLRQLQEANQADQQRIFDKQYETGSTGDADSRRNLSMEIGKIQMQMVRRGEQQKKLREEIATLEGKLGIPAQKAEGAEK